MNSIDATVAADAPLRAWLERLQTPRLGGPLRPPRIVRVVSSSRRFRQPSHVRIIR